MVLVNRLDAHYSKSKKPDSGTIEFDGIDVLGDQMSYENFRLLTAGIWGISKHVCRALHYFCAA
jgi:hypothetical protein